MKIISMDWSEELNMLVAISPDSGVPLIYSYNGINWFAYLGQLNKPFE